MHEGSAAIWHLADLLAWLQDESGYSLDRRLMEVAQVALQVNVTKEARRIAAAANRTLAALVV